MEKVVLAGMEGHKVMLAEHHRVILAARHMVVQLQGVAARRHTCFAAVADAVDSPADRRADTHVVLEEDIQGLPLRRMAAVRMVVVAVRMAVVAVRMTVVAVRMTVVAVRMPAAVRKVAVDSCRARMGNAVQRLELRSVYFLNKRPSFETH